MVIFDNISHCPGKGEDLQSFSVMWGAPHSSDFKMHTRITVLKEFDFHGFECIEVFYFILYLLQFILPLNYSHHPSSYFVCIRLEFTKVIISLLSYFHFFLILSFLILLCLSL